jgi:hypothetical protein
MENLNKFCDKNEEKFNGTRNIMKKKSEGMGWKCSLHVISDGVLLTCGNFNN